MDGDFTHRRPHHLCGFHRHWLFGEPRFFGRVYFSAHQLLTQFSSLRPFLSVASDHHVHHSNAHHLPGFRQFQAHQERAIRLALRKRKGQQLDSLIELLSEIGVKIKRINADTYTFQADQIDINYLASEDFRKKSGILW